MPGPAALPPSPPSLPASLGAAKPYLVHHQTRRLPGLAVGLLCTLGIFLLLPLTQMIASLGKRPPDPLTVEVALAPPPPPPLDLEPPEPPPPEPPPPEVQPPPQQLSLSQLDVALNLGTGDALAGAFSFDGFGVTADDTASDMALFDIKDLDRAPRLLRPGRLIYPPEMRRARITGTVTLQIIIAENGTVSVERVVDSPNRDFEQAAIAFARDCQFEQPLKNGRPVRARYTWPIQFAL